mmetsp:Transcript_27468/g.85740  ORF Transcript_27468/g.85740 Transcript_27468/m.85740 type:complete len:326 (+) Transcript_27468:100-1077(+)
MRALMRKGGGGRAPRARSHRGLDAELLHGVEARGQLRDELARDCEHGHAAVVQLLAPHLLGVLVEAEGVAVAARLVGGLDPPGGLKHAHAEQQDREAGGPLAGAERRQARGHLLKPGQLRVVRRHGARGRHHGDPAVLDLGLAEVPEAVWVVLEGHQRVLREAQRVEEAQGPGDARLLGRHQHRLGHVEAEASGLVRREHFCLRSHPRRPAALSARRGRQGGAERPARGEAMLAEEDLVKEHRDRDAEGQAHIHNQGAEQHQGGGVKVVGNRGPDERIECQQQQCAERWRPEGLQAAAVSDEKHNWGNANRDQTIHAHVGSRVQV